jgi:hypothetical protein
MSYDFYLVDDKGEVIKGSHNFKGGTYRVGGSEDLTFNITFNYSPLFSKVICPDLGVKKIIGMKSKDSVTLLIDAINKLDPNDINDDYWKCCEGNARSSLIALVNLALMAPHGVWRCTY